MPCIHSLAELLPAVLAENANTPLPGSGGGAGGPGAASLASGGRGRSGSEEGIEGDEIAAEASDWTVDASNALSSQSAMEEEAEIDAEDPGQRAGDRSSSITLASGASVPLPSGMVPLPSVVRPSSPSTIPIPVTEGGKQGGRNGKRQGNGGRPLPSKEMVARESARLKSTQDAYFSGGGGGGGGGGKKSSASAAGKMLASRAHLPASSSREEVTAAVQNTPVVILSGETGCGKSTQVPKP